LQADDLAHADAKIIGQTLADNHRIVGEYGIAIHEPALQVGDGGNLVRLDSGDRDRRPRLAADDKAIAHDLRRHRLDPGHGLDAREEGLGGAQRLTLAAGLLLHQLHVCPLGQQQARIAARRFERHMGNVAHRLLHEIDREPADQGAHEDEDEDAGGYARDQQAGLRLARCEVAPGDLDPVEHGPSPRSPGRRPRGQPD